MDIDQPSMIPRQEGGADGEERHQPNQIRPEKRLARGLEDVTQLFVSRPADGGAKNEDQGTPDPARGSPGQPSVIVLRPAPGINRELLIQLVSKNTAALEDGMRTIDMNVPCDSCGPIDLLALDGNGQLAVIDLETSAGDALLLRAVSHLDWLVRNVPIVRRMYHGQSINFSSEPRIFLLSPRFSPPLICAAHRIAAPRIRCLRFHTVALPGGTGIFFECI